MTPEHWQTVKRILETALDREAPERERYLDEACAPGTELRREVDALLALEVEADGFLEEPAFDLHGGTPEPPVEGRTIDRYRLIREIGAGGMGRVYLAERADAAFEQRVAVKILKRGLDTDDVVARFRRERQILANLEHPHIARILDGGTTEDGLPYLVAEYVEGTPIDRYCEHHELTVAQRLDLFCRVCDAVQFAHQNFVVHRDLKPGNILVTEDGSPKLLDFGIAKLLSPDGEDAYRTRLGVHFVTPEVASPEQLRGERITTATDVYSLGVLLYTLLTEHNPHTLHGTSREAIERAVLEDLPDRPSLVAPTELRRTLRGDLDNILLKALRKEPDRRYGTPRELADDIERYLSELPVTASGDAWSYRLPKLLKRYKLAVAAASLILLLVTSFTVIAVSLFNQTDRQRQRAERISSFLEEMITASEPARARGEELTVREALDSGRKTILDGLDEEPELKAELMSTMARVYDSLGLYDDARELFSKALALRRRTLGDDDVLVAESLQGLSGVLLSLGYPDKAEELLREALEIERKHYGEDDPRYLQSLNNLAIIFETRHEFDRAEPLHREVLEKKKRLLGPDDPEVALSLHNLAKDVFYQHRPKEAETLYRQALVLRERQAGEDSPEVARTLNSLGSVVEAEGRLDEAEALYRRALAVRRKLYPKGHRDLAVSLSNLGRLLLIRGRYDEAEALLRESQAMMEKFLPPGHAYRATVQANLDVLAARRAKAREAGTADGADGANRGAARPGRASGPP